MIRLHVQVNVLVGAHLRRPRDAVEIAAQFTIVDRNQIEEQEENNEEYQHEHEADPDEEDLLLPVVRSERNKRQQSVR